MNGIDPKSLPSLTTAKQTVIERDEQFEIERQLFRDLSGVGVLKRDTKPDTGKAPTTAPRQPSVQPVKAAVTKKAAAALDFVAEVVASIFNFFDTPREMTREEIYRAHREAA